MDPFKKTKNDVAYLQYFISLFIYFILSAFIGSQGKKDSAIKKGLGNATYLEGFSAIIWRSRA